MAIVALIWPSRLSGILDGAPLDTLPEALLLAPVPVALAWLHPSALRSRLMRAAVIAILVLKAGAALSVQQEGWCLTFTPPKPMVRDSTGKPHAWDIRADWRSSDPVCSAVMTRSYQDSFELPAWFFNLPPPDDAPHRDGYAAGQIPVRVSGTGFITIRSAGTFDLLTTPAMGAALQIDGREMSAAAPGHHRVDLSSGTHSVQFDATLLGKEWRIVPEWNGTPMGSMLFPATTPTPPSRLDRLARPAGNWLALILAGAVMVQWLVSFAIRLRAPTVLIWMAAAAIAVSFAAWRMPAEAAWLTAAVMIVPLLMPAPWRVRNLRGVFLLAGIPWLAYVVAINAHQVGRWTLYGVGNDEFQFQRFAYRIFMQQYWLEGGQVTFWNQPLFRWIAGALHMLFGDSSVGQAYWDAGGVVVMALFAYRVIAPVTGFAMALMAAILPFAMFLLGPARQFVGFGLSEISSAGLIYLAAFFAMRRRGVDALAAGILVTLGFYTRLNNLPMAIAVAAFALPLTVPARALWRPRAWWPQVHWRTAIAVFASLAIGVVLFAWRTWYYTGVFSFFHGTQREHLAVWKPGMPAAAVIESMVGSLMMVLTASDPPHLAWHSAPLLAAAAIATLALAGAPGVRNAPLGLVLFFLAGCSSALVTRGWAYEGRFSIHLFGAAGALCAWGISAIARRLVQVWYSPAHPLEKVTS